MDEELESFEAELKQLRPVRPMPELESRIARELEKPRRRRGSIWWLAAAPLPIAAAITMLVALTRNDPGQNGKAVTEASLTPADAAASVVQPVGVGISKDTLKPVSAENVLYAATDEGLVTLADGTTARRERLKFVDTIKWQNPRTHASLTWSVPREEVRVVPVRYQ